MQDQIECYTIKSFCKIKINYVITFSLFLDPYLLNQYSPVPRARSSIVQLLGRTLRDSANTGVVGARVARAQIYAGLGRPLPPFVIKFVIG